MEFKIDFSEIDLVALRQLNISSKEIDSVVNNPNSFHGDLGQDTFLLGFSDKRKFIRAVYRIAKKANF
jgi:hypothetical protein